MTITGEFLHDREFLISPRGRLDTEHLTEEHRRTAGSLISMNTSSHGAHVITPFRIANSEFVPIPRNSSKQTHLLFSLVILVNRGWVPLSHVTAASRQAGQVKGTVTLNAIVRGCEKVPSNDVDAVNLLPTDAMNLA